MAAIPDPKKRLIFREELQGIHDPRPLVTTICSRACPRARLVVDEQRDRGRGSGFERREQLPPRRAERAARVERISERCEASPLRMRGEYVSDRAGQAHADPRHRMWVVSVGAKDKPGGQADDAEQTQRRADTLSIDQKSATISEIQRSQNDHAVRFGRAVLV
jgi:hypothetical protein